MNSRRGELRSDSGRGGGGQGDPAPPGGNRPAGGHSMHPQQRTAGGSGTAAEDRNVAGDPGLAGVMGEHEADRAPGPASGEAADATAAAHPDTPALMQAARMQA